MAANIYDLSTTAASNTTIDGVDVSGSTGKVKDGDNVMRSLGAYMAQVLDDLGGVATTAGTANAQTVTLASGFTAYATGNLFTVKIGSGLTNTSSTVTLAVNSISGAKTVKVNYGGVLANPIPGDIQAGAYATFLYDGTYLVLLTAQQQARYPDGHLKGLTLSNDAGDATNDVGIAVGGCRDSTDAANIDLASALIKKLDAAWAVGTNQGMLDGTESVAGTPDTSTWYHIWLIKRPDTGVVDVLASESATAPTMPTNYTLKRRIGAVYNNSAGDIRAFKQLGDTFLLDVISADFAAGNPGTSAVLRTLAVPTGVKVEAIISARLLDTTADADTYCLYTSPEQTDTTPTSTLYNMRINGAVGAPVLTAEMEMRIRTDTSGQIRTRIHASTADTFVIGSTIGWVDRRGRDA